MNLHSKIVYNTFLFVSSAVNPGVKDFKFNPCARRN